MKSAITKFGAALCGLSLVIAPASALAAGTSTFSLQLSGNTISVYETSSVTVNTVEADFAYTDSQNVVQSVNVTTGSTFSTCINPTSTSIVCSALGGNVTGTHLVATLIITLKAGTSSASVGATMLGSSAIYSSVDSSDTLDHSNLPSTTYTYTAPAPVTPPASSGNNGGTPAPSKPTTTASHTTATTTASTSTNTEPSTPTVKADTTAKVKPPVVTIATAAAKTNGPDRTVLSISGIIVVLILGAALWFINRANLTPAPAKQSARKSAKHSK